MVGAPQETLLEAGDPWNPPAFLPSSERGSLTVPGKELAWLCVFFALYQSRHETEHTQLTQRFKPWSLIFKFAFVKVQRAFLKVHVISTVNTLA